MKGYKSVEEEAPRRGNVFQGLKRSGGKDGEGMRLSWLIE